MKQHKDCATCRSLGWTLLGRAFSDNIRIPDSTPLKVRVLPIVFQDTDITEVAELYKCYKELKQAIFKPLGVEWNDEEGYYEGENINRAFKLLRTTMDELVKQYLKSRKA